MSRNLNKVEIIGFLSADPKAHQTTKGTPISSFTVPTSSKWGDQEVTEWNNIEAFGKLAEICNQYLTKGTLVYIEGTLRTEKWEKDGVQKSMTKIIANYMLMLSSDKSSGKEQAAPAPVANTTQQQSDDDLPF